MGFSWVRHSLPFQHYFSICTAFQRLKCPLHTSVAASPSGPDGQSGDFEGACVADHVLEGFVGPFSGKSQRRAPKSRTSPSHIGKKKKNTFYNKIKMRTVCSYRSHTVPFKKEFISDSISYGYNAASSKNISVLG